MPKRIGPLKGNARKADNDGKKNLAGKILSRKPNNSSLHSKKESPVKSRLSLNNKNSFDIKKILTDSTVTNKNILIMGVTVVTTGIFGIVALNTIINPGENVEAVEQVVLPERKMPGVNKEGQKYADDASVVMEKLQNYQYRNDGKKVVYLTFDDGPSQMSNKILDILDKNDVKATFFVTGQSIEHTGKLGKDVLQRIYNSGNAVANHSYSHDYNLLYPNGKLDFSSFIADFEKTNTLLKDVLGEDFTTEVIRCPGGHMSWKGMDELESYLKQTGMASIDWNALSGDAVGRGKTSEDLYAEVVATSKGKEMVVLLMHDASSKESTVKSLQKIIDYYRANGYEFRTLV